MIPLAPSMRFYSRIFFFFDTFFLRVGCLTLGIGKGVESQSLLQ